MLKGIEKLNEKLNDTFNETNIECLFTVVENHRIISFDEYSRDFATLRIDTEERSILFSTPEGSLVVKQGEVIQCDEEVDAKAIKTALEDHLETWEDDDAPQPSFFTLYYRFKKERDQYRVKVK